MEEVSNEFPKSVQGYSHAARGVDRGRDVAGSGRVLIGLRRGSSAHSGGNARHGCNACGGGNAYHGCNICCDGDADYGCNNCGDGNACTNA